MSLKLTTKEAMNEIRTRYPKLNRGQLGRMLNRTPQALIAYEKGTRASQTVADKVLELFDIEITDVGKQDRPITKDELERYK